MIEPFVPKQSLQASHLNQIVDAVNELAPTSGGSLPSQSLPAITFPFVGKVVEAGPNGEGNYSDERYWVAVQVNTLTTSSASYGPNARTELTNVANNHWKFDKIVTVHNMFEKLDASHELSTGQFCTCFPMSIDQSTVTTPQIRYFMDKAPFEDCTT